MLSHFITASAEGGFHKRISFAPYEKLSELTSLKSSIRTTHSKMKKLASSSGRKEIQNHAELGDRVIKTCIANMDEFYIINNVTENGYEWRVVSLATLQASIRKLEMSTRSHS